MSDIFKRVKKVVGKIVNKVSNSLSQDENTVHQAASYETEGFGALVRQAGAESIVLLRNNGVLPLDKGREISLFGRCQYDFFYIGYGSGGDVIAPYKVNLVDGIKNIGGLLNGELLDKYVTWATDKDNVPDHGFWGHWPYCFEEMPLDRATVEKARATSEVAVVVIGRAAGEDRENTLTQGSYYLTDAEKAMLDLVTDVFDKTVILMNCGNVVDMAWLHNYGDKIAALLYVWQLGEESGNAIAEVLYGITAPSGKLPVTIARSYEDYPSAKYFGNRDYNEYVEDVYVGYRYFETFAPDKVLFPFGYGLTYTSMELAPKRFAYVDGKVTATVAVRNTGARAGREVVEIYCRPPQGKLGKPLMNLVAFAKTKELAPCEEIEIEFAVDEYKYSSYDEAGVTGNPSSYVLEEGEYLFFAGTDVRDVIAIGSYVNDSCKTLARLAAICPVEADKAFEVIYPVADGEGYKIGRKKAYVGNRDMKARIETGLDEELPHVDKKIDFSSVVNGTVSLDDFIATLSDRELETLSRGEGKMNSSRGVAGNAGAYAGVSDSLAAKGVPAVITSDGPAGLRLRKQTALIPCGTAIAATWNVELVEELLRKESEEMLHYDVDVLLAPGMNIERNPLCGRNFEYFSEDPLLSGLTAAAYVNGVQAAGASACPKHFACNNQEVNRNYNDSRVSERALREIYLKGFEICVKESAPKNIMTSYNKINGVWSHYNYDTATTVLRGEWGYKGLVITDWWMRRSESPEFPGVKDNAYRIRAGVDVLMPGEMRGVPCEHSALKRLNKRGGITRAELQRTARRVLETALNLRGGKK